ncbi:MAG: hypothetical protein ACXWOL_02560 [Ktedonobacteraceae bacterium]
MDTTVFVAIITGISAIIVAFITTLITILGAWLISSRDRERNGGAVSHPKPDGAEATNTTLPVKPDGTQQPATLSNGKHRRPVVILLAAVAIISLIMGGVLGYFFIAVPVVKSCGPFVPTSVTITSPASDSKVSSQILIQGTACHIPQDKELWLLVTVEGVSGYFPQGNAANPHPIMVRSDGTWSVTAYLGGSADIGKKFVLIPALVDQNDKEAKDAIQTYFQQTGPAYVPIDPLPSGIQLMSQVSVVRS